MTDHSAGAEPAEPAVSGTVPDCLLVGRAAVTQAWHGLLCGLGPAQRGLQLVDARLADYPLGEPEVLNALTAWLRLPGRRIRLLALEFETAARMHPRFARWRRDWVHRLEFLSPAEPPTAPWPSLLLNDSEGIQWLDGVHWRARRSLDTTAWRASIDAIAQRCEPSWPLTPLGL